LPNVFNLDLIGRLSYIKIMLRQFSLFNPVVETILVLLAVFIQPKLSAEELSIENLVSTASAHFGKNVTIEGYAACPDCFQIESGGCSGVFCTGNLVLQESSTGGPEVAIAGSYNGNRIASESDGCVLMATPLHIGWKYRIWGVFRPYPTVTEGLNYTISIDSFKAEEQTAETFGIDRGSFFEGTGPDHIAYSFDSTNKRGSWFHLRAFAPHNLVDDRFDTLDRGTFIGALVNNSWDGPWTSFFTNNRVRSQGSYLSGAKSGDWREFDSLGNILSQGSYVKGQEKGLWKRKLRIGAPPALFDYGAQPGKIVISEYSPDSVLDTRVTIDRVFSTIERFETFFRSGKTKRLVEHDPISGTASIEEWCDNGRVRCKQSFAKGTFTDSLWHENGALWKVKKKDFAGALNDFVEWRDDGSVLWRGAFKGFAAQGSWVRADSQGRRETSIPFENGVPSGSTFSNKDRSFKFTSFTNTKVVNTLIATRQGIWAGTNGGACFFSKNGTLETKLTTADGLPGNVVMAIAQDSTGTLWFGTEHNSRITEVGGSACCISFVGQPLAKLTTQNGFLGTVIAANAGDTTGTNLHDASDYLLGALTKSRVWGYHDAVGSDQNATGISYMTVSADGTVWNSSLNGLQRISPPLPEKLCNRLSLYLGRISAPSDSSVWVLGLDSVYRYKNDSIFGFRPIDSAPVGDLIAVHHGSDGKLYLLTAKGIFFFSNNGFRKIIALTTKSTLVLTDFFLDRNGSFLIATSRGIERAAKNNISTVVIDIAQLDKAAITAFVKDSSTLWIGTKNGVYRFADNRVLHCVVPEGPRGANAALVNAGVNHDVWMFAKGAGIYRFDGKTWTLFDVSAKMPNCEIVSLLPDQNNGLWIGTGNGIVHLSKSLSIEPALSDRLAQGSISNLAFDRAGSLLYVKDQNLIVSFDGRRFRTLYNQPILIDGPIRAFAVDNTGMLWISNNRGIVTVVNGNSRETYSSGRGLPLIPITRFFVDARNAIYAVSLQTVYHFDGTQWNSIFTEDNINGSIISGITQDRQKRLWVGTKNGLFRFEKSKVARFTQRDGLIGNRINDLAVDANDEVWIATEQGLSKYSDRIRANGK
jgi:ligand-binding sensor domain-containing protein